VANTEQFCISCHEMRDNVYKELQQTIHFKNRSGVRARCSDCHVPHEWFYKVRRKIQASLKEAGGQKPRAADLLQVSYKTLLQKLKDYGIEG